MSREPRIVLLERDDFTRELLTDYLVGHGFRVQAEAQLEEAVGAFKKGPVPVVVAGIGPGGFPVAELAARIGRVSPHTALVAVLARDATEDRLRAFRDGAIEVLEVPITADELALAVTRCLETVRLLEQFPEMRRYVWAYFAARRIQRAPDLNTTALALLNAAHASSGADAALALAPVPDPPGGLELCATVNLDADSARELAAAWNSAALTGAVADPLAPSAVLRFPPGAGPLAALKGKLAKQAAELVVVRVGAPGRERMWAGLLFTAKTAAKTPAGLPAGAAADLAVYAGEAAFALDAATRFADAAEPAIDPVTDLYDERHLLRTLDQEVRRKQESGDARLSMLVVSLNGFREINEQHGHLVAGRVLVEAARLVVRSVRDADLVARTGPSEFGLLLVSADQPAAERIAERIRASFERHMFLAREGMDLRVTATIGVASYPVHGANAQELRAAAVSAVDRLSQERNVIAVAEERATKRRGRGG